MKDLSKKIYINTAYDIMMEEGFNKVSIRKIANKLGVSSTSLYRHFDNLEELKVYASLRYLRSYIRDVKRLGYDALSSMKGYYDYWRLFAEYSFKEPDAYNLVFFKKSNGYLENIFRDYYTIFSEEIKDLDKSLIEWITTADIHTRVFINLKNAAGDDTIPEEKLRKVADIHTYIYKGILKDYFDGVEMDEDIVENYISLCESVFDSIIGA